MFVVTKIFPLFSLGNGMIISTNSSIFLHGQVISSTDIQSGKSVLAPWLGKVPSTSLSLNFWLQTLFQFFMVLCHLSKQYYFTGLFYPQTVLHRILPSGYHGLFFCMSSVFNLIILVCGLETLSVTSVSWILSASHLLHYCLLIPLISSDLLLLYLTK